MTQAKDNWEKMKAATEEATDMIENSYSTASKGASDYGLALIDAARANANATFDFYSQIVTAKSLSEFIELSTSHARKQFEAMTAQSKDLTALAQKVATESAAPIRVRACPRPSRKSPEVRRRLSPKQKARTHRPGLFLSESALGKKLRTGGALLAKAGPKP